MRLTAAVVFQAALRSCWTLWLLLFPVCEAIRCYTCENERSNFMCISETNLVNCDIGMDTCQTIVAFNDVSDKLSIIKTCTKNSSCEAQVNVTRLETPCDESRSSWVCTTCCYEDACNLNSAHSSQPTWNHLLILALSVGLFILTGHSFGQKITVAL